MKKRMMALLLALCMVLAMVPVRAQAAQVQVGKIQAAPADLNVEGMVSRVASEAAENTVRPNGQNKVNVYKTKGGEVSVEIKLIDDVDYYAYVTVTPDKGYIWQGILAEALSGDEAPDIYFRGNMTFEVRLPYDSDVDIYVVFGKPEGEQHQITVEVDEDPQGGTYTLTKTKAYAGEQIFLNLDLKEEDHYSRAYVNFSAGFYHAVLDHKHSEERYEMLMPDADVTISIRFLKDQPISLSSYSYGGGTIELDIKNGYPGDVFHCTIKPRDGYRINYIYAQDYTGMVPLKYVGSNRWQGVIREDAGHVGIDVTFVESENPFLDVPDDAFYYEPVMWALENGITNGTDLSHFDPGGTCMRAHVVTFLWRAAGCPQPTNIFHPFTDIKETDFFYNAVLWAVEKGITNGLSDTTFGPYAQCNRAQVVTFLWRYRGSPMTVGAENPFADVASGQWYTDAVLWAVDKGITNGLSATEFGVTTACNRAQIVTFLHRMAQLPADYAVHSEFDAALGTVTMSHETAAPGQTVTATVLPIEGYLIESVTCLGGTAVTQVSDTEYTFVMPDREETLQVTFAEIPVEPTEPDPTEPDPTEPEPTEPEPTEPEPTDPTEPEKPVKTYELDLRDNGNGQVAYVDGKTTAAPGESIFFYAVPNPGYELTNVGIFNPNNEIDVSLIQLYEHGNDLYELVMIDHDIIMTCYFTPIG